jgi:hypothetical protein
MFRTLSVLALIASPALAAAQAPQFRWQAGQTLTYRVSQHSTARESSAEKETVTETKLELTKKWTVQAVDAKGVATLSMALDRLRMETRSPGGEVLLFDSAARDKSTPALAEELKNYIGVPLTVVRIDSLGQLIEVKESRFGPASRLEADLPFKITLPAAALAAGQSWERKYQVKLEPPHGSGEAYPAVQAMKCRLISGTSAVIDVTTSIAAPEGNAIEQIPLMPLQPAGEVVFDTGTGRLKSVKYRWAKQTGGHLGDGSKYVYESTYIEELQ